MDQTTSERVKLLKEEKSLKVSRSGFSQRYHAVLIEVNSWSARINLFCPARKPNCAMTTSSTKSQALQGQH